MLPSAKKGLAPTLICLCSKMLKQEKRQKVGFLREKVGRKSRGEKKKVGEKKKKIGEKVERLKIDHLH